MQVIGADALSRAVTFLRGIDPSTPRDKVQGLVDDFLTKVSPQRLIDDATHCASYWSQTFSPSDETAVDHIDINRPPFVSGLDTIQSPYFGPVTIQCLALRPFRDLVYLFRLFELSSDPSHATSLEAVARLAVKQLRARIAPLSAATAAYATLANAGNAPHLEPPAAPFDPHCVRAHIVSATTLAYVAQLVAVAVPSMADVLGSLRDDLTERLAAVVRGRVADIAPYCLSAAYLSVTTQSPLRAPSPYVAILAAHLVASRAAVTATGCPLAHRVMAAITIDCVAPILKAVIHGVGIGDDPATRPPAGSLPPPPRDRVAQQPTINANEAYAAKVDGGQFAWPRTLTPQAARLVLHDAYSLVSLALSFLTRPTPPAATDGAAAAARCEAERAAWKHLLVPFGVRGAPDVSLGDASLLLCLLADATVLPAVAVLGTLMPPGDGESDDDEGAAALAVEVVAACRRALDKVSAPGQQAATPMGVFGQVASVLLSATAAAGAAMDAGVVNFAAMMMGVEPTSTDGAALRTAYGLADPSRLPGIPSASAVDPANGSVALREGQQDALSAPAGDSEPGGGPKRDACPYRIAERIVAVSTAAPAVERPDALPELDPRAAPWTVTCAPLNVDVVTVLRAVSWDDVAAAWALAHKSAPATPGLPPPTASAARRLGKVQAWAHDWAERLRAQRKRPAPAAAAAARASPGAAAARVRMRTTLGSSVGAVAGTASGQRLGTGSFPSGTSALPPLNGPGGRSMTTSGPAASHASDTGTRPGTRPATADGAPSSAPVQAPVTLPPPPPPPPTAESA